MASSLSKKIHLKTGTYHIESLNYDYDCFFDILEKHSIKHREETRNDDLDPKYVYRIIYTRRERDYLALSMHRVNKKAEEESLYDDSNDIGTVGIPNHPEGFSWIYFDKHDNVIVEDNKVVSTKCLTDLISKIIEKYLLYEGDPRHHSFSGKENFDMTFDRFNNKDLDEFYASAHLLLSVTSKAKTLSNPFRNRDEKAKEMDRDIKETGMKRLTLASTDGLNKESTLITSIVGLTKDGHFDTVFVGSDKDDRIITHESTSKQDDIYIYDDVSKQIDAFVDIAKNLAHKILVLHSRPSDDEVPKLTDGIDQKDDDVEKRP